MCRLLVEYLRFVLYTLFACEATIGHCHSDGLNDESEAYFLLKRKTLFYGRLWKNVVLVVALIVGKVGLAYALAHEGL